MTGLGWHNEPEEEKINDEEKEKLSRDIVKDSITNAKISFVCFSGGKRSTVLRHLIKRGYECALNVLHVDTTVNIDNVYLYNRDDAEIVEV